MVRSNESLIIPSELHNEIHDLQHKANRMLELSCLLLVKRLISSIISFQLGRSYLLLVKGGQHQQFLAIFSRLFCKPVEFKILVFRDRRNILTLLEKPYKGTLI